MSQLNVEVVAADRLVWEGQARQVSARSIEGELGVLPGHEPLLAVLTEGEVTLEGEGQTQRLHVDGGFLSVDADQVRIVSETITPASS